MVSTVWISCVAALLLVKATNAFVKPSFVARPSISPLFSASMGTTEGKVLAKQFQRMEQDELWLEQLSSPQIQQVRTEMLQKYIACGKSAETAEREVDAFLRDREKAQPFIEMRQYAKRKFDDMGLEIIVQTTTIFFVCLFATIGLQYYSAYMVSNASSVFVRDSKIPFLTWSSSRLFPCRLRIRMVVGPFPFGKV